MLKSMYIIAFTVWTTIQGPDLWIPKYSDLWHRGIFENKKLTDKKRALNNWILVFLLD